jgi:hypothetical protein
VAGVLDRPEQRLRLALPADERRGPLLGLPPADDRADDRRADRLGLALRGERLDRSCVERGLRAVEDDLRLTRAAVLMASPKTRYERRYQGPKSPVKTRPVLTPMRMSISPGASMISRSARSIRSSSRPVVEGAPAVSSAFTLDLPTSDS